MFKLIFPTLKVINYYYMAVIKMSHDQLFNLYRTALSFFVFFFLNFTRYFRLKLNCTSQKKQKEKKMSTVGEK